jgi:NADH-ubiquinone oxidoreductase chain 2
MILTFLLLLLFSNGLTTRPDTSILYSRVGILIIFYSIISTMSSFHITYLQKGIGLYGGLFNVTPITHSFQIFILLICGIILLLTGFYPRKKHKGDSTSLLDTLSKKTKEYTSIINKVSEQFTIIEYALIIIFVITGATLLLASGDLGSIYLCIELQSFSLYIISAMHRNSESSTGSALTYFLLGGLSSCFILLGVALIYANSGLTNLDGIYSIISDSERYLNFSTWYMHTYIFYSFILISVGFLFKIAAAPFHWWSPDVYDGVPTIVTTFIAILGKISILVLFLELSHYTSTLIYSMIQLYSWTISLSISCFFSLIIGTVLGLTQIRIKRLLAYSTISHIGFILLALIVHNIESYQAYIFYIMQYILTNLNAFLTIIAIGFSLYLYHTNISENNNLSEKNNSPIQLISQLKGYFSINPLLAMCLVVSMFSFVGLPPLMGFFGKQMVLTSALDNNNTILVIVAILTSVIGAVYYLSVIKTIYFDKSDYNKSYIFVQVSLSNYLSISLAILTLIISLFILMPNEPLNLCSLLASSLSETINFDFNQKDLYRFFNETLLLDYTIKYKYYYNILVNSLNNILAGLYIILVSMSENIMSINSILQHKPELDTSHKNKQEQEIITINVCYTTKDIDGSDFRVIYDNNETAGTRLTFLYMNSPRYRPIPETININGQQYNGLRFYSSNISTPNPGRGLYNPSFRFTQHEMRDGIWTPKPAGAVGRITGLFSTTGERILANGQIPRLSHNNLQMFIPGGRNNS